MRSRNIKPGFFKNEVLGMLNPLARLLFSGLWCMADREGRIEDRPLRIKAEILPYDNCEVDSLLDELMQSGFIQRYQVDGEGYIQIINFSKHQNPHKRETPSEIPPCSCSSTTKAQPRQDLGKDDTRPRFPNNAEAEYQEGEKGSDESVVPAEDNAETLRSDCDKASGSKASRKKHDLGTTKAGPRQEPARLIPDSLIPDSLIPTTSPTDADEGDTKPSDKNHDPSVAEMELCKNFAIAGAFEDLRKNPAAFYKKLEEWEDLYPELPVSFEVKKATQWLRDNPGKRHKLWSRFMGNWLSRAHDSRKTASGTTVPSARQDLAVWAVVNGAIQKLGSSASVRFWDPAIHNAIWSLGGWIKLCRYDPAQREREFCRSYPAGVGMSWKDDVPEYLVGEREVTERNIGRAGVIPPVAFIAQNGEVSRYVRADEKTTAECRP